MPSEHSINTFLRSFYDDPITRIWKRNDKNSAVNGDSADHGDSPS